MDFSAHFIFSWILCNPCHHQQSCDSSFPCISLCLSNLKAFPCTVHPLLSIKCPPWTERRRLLEFLARHLFFFFLKKFGEIAFLWQLSKTPIDSILIPTARRLCGKRRRERKSSALKNMNGPVPFTLVLLLAAHYNLCSFILLLSLWSPIMHCHSLLITLHTIT